METVSRTCRALVAVTLVVALTFVWTGCGRSTAVLQAAPRMISLEVEVYDPVTQYVWEGVDVRIVEAEHEWSGVTVQNPEPDDWFRTGASGTVYWSPGALAQTSIGFVESARGEAIIEPERDADEAYVLVELAATGFPTTRVEAYIRWREPDALLSVPFSPID